MQLWLDNTGLQTAASCLAGIASREHRDDVDGLLQLATLLIYGNKLSLNGFEPYTLSERTRGIVEDFKSIGVTDDILTILPTKRSDYEEACKRAADSTAPTLCNVFKPKPVGAKPHIEILSPELRARWLRFKELAHEKEGSAKLEDAKTNALNDKAAGAVEYMMAASPALREAVARLVRVHPTWREEETHQLNAFLRYQLNDALRPHFSKYAPAVARAKLVHSRNLYIVERVGKFIVDERKKDDKEGLLDSTVRDFRARIGYAPLGVPSTIAALLKRSKGEPLAVLEEAMKLREKSEPLRNYLQDLATWHSDDRHETHTEIAMKMMELGQPLRSEFGLEKAATPGAVGLIRIIEVIADGIALYFGNGVATWGKDVVKKWGKELGERVVNKSQREKIEVLTELVWAAATIETSEAKEWYDRLCRNATRNAP